MEEFHGSLKILSLVADNEKLVSNAEKTLILYGLMLTGQKITSFPDALEPDALLDTDRQEKRARLTT
tara:strand:+ start:390 stop:590 length:201 start_codon:yes stop_codon:yes gene_type:complete